MPRITAGGAGGGPPPPGGDDHFCPKVIVGNVPAGDPAAAQAAPFQYIGDPGDGTGIAAALSALPAGGGDVCVRPGAYTLSAAVLPLVIPTNSTLFGAGGGTLLRNLSGTRRIFTVGMNGEVHGVNLFLGAAPQGSAGTEVVSLATGAAFRESMITMSGPSLDETLTAMVRTAVASARTRTEAITLLGVLAAQFGVALDGSDHGVEDLILDGEALAGVAFAAGSSRCTAQAVRGVAGVGFRIEGERHAIDGTIDVPAAGVGADLVDCNRCRVELVSQAALPAAGSVGVRVVSGSRNVASGCILEGHGTGISIGALASRTIVVGNQLEAVVPLVDAGTLTEAAHNGLLLP
jgi:hypothetical protein